MPKIISIGPPIMKKQPFKSLKSLSSLVPFISKIKRADIFNFLSVKYFNKHLSFLEIWHIWVKCCWNYGPSNLLFCFTRHTLQQPKNRQRKIAINSLIYLFESYYQKKCLVKFSSFLTYWLENDDPLKVLWNLMEKTFYRQFLASLGMIKVVF